MVEEISLKVAEAKQRDVGRGKARIDDNAMKILGVVAGDAIEITGKRKTATVAWPAYNEDQGKDIIRMDGLIRKNAAISLNEYITARKADVKEAQKVVLMPVDMRLNVDWDFTNFVKKLLIEAPSVEGDSTFVVVLGSSIPFIVKSTEPQGVVKIVQTTNLQVLSEPEPSLEERMKRLEEKTVQRFAWLKEMEKRYASKYTKFRVPELVEDDKEEPVLDEAKKKAKDTSELVRVFVDLWEKREKIGSFDWALVKPDGTVEYVYEKTVRTRPFAEGEAIIINTLKTHEIALDRLEKQLEAIAEKLKKDEEKKS